MMISMLAPRGALSLALVLSCSLAASCAGTAKDTAFTPRQSVLVDSTSMDMSYEPGSDVALEWVSGGSLAMVANGQLTFVQGGINTLEVPIETGPWPVELAFGGDLLAVCFPEQRIEIYQLDVDGLPLLSVEPETLAQVLPIVTIEISSLAGGPFDKSEPSPRRVFAMRGDGNLIAMTGPTGNVNFGNPRTGWPNPIVSIRLPKDSGIPLATRFRGAGSVDGLEGEMVVTAQLEDGSLVEWVLNSELTLWSDAKPIRHLADVDSTGGSYAFVSPENPAEVVCLNAAGEQLWTSAPSTESVDAIAGTTMGYVAVAAGGKLTVLAPR